MTFPLPPSGVQPLSSLAEHIKLERLQLDRHVATEILKLFKWSVGSTVVITISMVIVDTITLWFGVIKPSERLVTEHVLMTLIGASVVQVGSASLAIVYSLFRKPRVADDDGE